MYGIAFDLNPAKAKQHHPRGVTRARADIDDVLGDQVFRPVQAGWHPSPRAAEGQADHRTDLVATSLEPLDRSLGGFPPMLSSHSVKSSSSWLAW